MKDIKTDLEFFDVVTEKAESNDSEQSIVHYISTPDLDRGRDIVNPKGMDAGEFEKTKTVFFNHNYYMPIGKNLWLKRTEDGVKAKTQFSKSNQLALDVYNLHKEGIINTWSIGFDYARDKTGKIAKDAIRTDEKTNQQFIDKWVLWEYSSAPLAMNPNALDQAKAIVKSVELKQVCQHGLCELELRNLITEQQEELIELKKSLETEPNDKLISELKKELEEIKQKLSKKVSEKAGLNITPSELSDAINKAQAGAFRAITGKKLK